MIAAAGKAGRHGVRDGTLILIAYRHGLRVSELVELRWEQVDLPRGTLHVNRKKSGDAATHPMSGRELRALRQLKRTYPESPFLFVTERGGPMTEATVRKLVASSGKDARIGLPVHPHMLRHGVGHRNLRLSIVRSARSKAACLASSSRHGTAKPSSVARVHVSG